MGLNIITGFSLAKPGHLTWTILTDIEQAAPCFPGAELREKLPDGGYKGLFTVKLGPLAFVFSGRFRIAEQDDAARMALVEASGTDTKGRGGANARVRITLHEPQPGESRVEIVSDVSLSGSVAQYGRGVAMIQALSQQLLDQFAANLAARIAAQQAARPRPDGAPGATTASAHAPLPSSAAASVNGAALAWKALRAAGRRWLGRLAGKRAST